MIGMRGYADNPSTLAAFRALEAVNYYIVSLAVADADWSTVTCCS